MGSRPSTAAAARADAELARELHSACLRLLRSLRELDARSPLSPAKLSTLSVLVFGGPRSLGELARLEQVRPPTMSRLVGALEREGLVLRAPHALDGRAIRLRASAKGRRALLAGRARRERELRRRLGALPAGERARLDAAVAALRALARPAGAARAPA